MSLTRSNPAALLRRALLPAGLLGLLSLSSCDLEFPDQEVHLRYSASTDSLDLLLIYKGLSASAENEKSVAKGVETVVRLMRGEREFMIVDWPLYFEIDKWAAEESEKLGNPETSVYDRSQARRFLAIAERVALVSHGLFLDADQRLSGYQHFRVREFGRVAGLLNQMISGAILDSQTDGRLEPDNEFDGRTIELLVQRAESGQPWFSLDAEGITVDLPFSLATTRKGRGELFHQLLKSDEDDEAFADLGAVLLASLSSVSFEQDRVVGTFRPDRSDRSDRSVRPGRFTLEIKNPAANYSDALRQALAARGQAIREDLSVEAVRALLK